MVESDSIAMFRHDDKNWVSPRRTIVVEESVSVVASGWLVLKRHILHSTAAPDPSIAAPGCSSHEAVMPVTDNHM